MPKRILYIQYTNPGAYPPLEHSSRLLAHSGWEVLFLGTGAHGANDLRFPAHQRVQVRQLTFCPPGWRQKLHYLWFCLWCLCWAVRWRPDWLYASDMLSCPAALLLHGLVGVRILYHEHDSPGPAGTSAFLRLAFRARRACAQQARICILPNQQRAERFQAETTPTNPVNVVWNCPALNEAASSQPLNPTRGLRLLYHGSIVPQRLPLTVVDALAQLSGDVTLTVIGYETVGSNGYLQALRSHAAQLGVGERVSCLGTLASRSRLMEVCGSCDVGLALMPRSSGDFNVQTMTGASNKPFDYLAKGLALLVSDLPDWQEMFVKPGYGLCCDPADPASIASAVRRFYDHPEEMRAMGANGLRRILTEWNYETQMLPILQVLGEPSARCGAA